MDAQDLLIGIAAALMLTILGLAVLYLTSNHRDALLFQQRLFVTAIDEIRFAAAVALLSPGVYQAIIGSSDASGWGRGRDFKETIDKSALGPLAIPQEMWLTGHQPGLRHAPGPLLLLDWPRVGGSPAAALSCFAGAMTAVMAYRLAQLIFSEEVAVKDWLVGLSLPVDDHLVNPDHQGTDRHPL